MKKRSGGKFLDKYKRREILWQKIKNYRTKFKNYMEICIIKNNY